MPRKEPRKLGRPKQPGRSVTTKAASQRQKRADANRDTEVRRHYGRRWNVESKEWRATYPACALCFEKGKFTTPQCVDHWKPHRGDAGLFWDRTNWVPLCFACHDGTKSRLELSWDNGKTPRQPPQLVTLDMVSEYITNGPKDLG